MTGALDSDAAGPIPRKWRVLLGLAALVPIVAVLGLPITGFWSFLLIVLAVILVVFGEIDRRPGRWAMAAGVTVVTVAVGQVLPSPRIEEGHNVFIAAEGTLPVFQKGLPAAVVDVMTAEFHRSYFVDTEGLPGSADWWDNGIFREPGYFARRPFARSADALWQRPKYSRIVDAIDFASQDQARIGAVNDLALNFIGAKARIDRRRLPFFVMAEMNSRLVGGRVCWRGHILWEGFDQKFDNLVADETRCRPVTRDDVGRRVFALSIARDRQLAFEVSPPLAMKLSLWAQAATRFAGFVAILAALVRIGALHRLLLPVGATVATLLTIVIMRPGFLTTARTHDGGNDGLTYESLGREIAAALHDGRWSDAWEGGASVYYFMPGMRYLRALEDFLFGDTSYGVVLIAIFLPIFLYAFMRSLLPLRWSVTLVVVFLFTPIFERFGFADFNYLRELTKGFAEPVGYAVFLGGLALVARHLVGGRREDVSSPNSMPTVWIGLAFAASVFMRPNLAVAAVLVVCAIGIWLLSRHRLGETMALAIAFASLVLIPLHNWYFGGVFVPLTSTVLNPANLGTPPAVYLVGIGELLVLNFAGENLGRVVGHLGAWNGWSDFYRVIAVFIVVWVAVRPRTPIALRVLAVVTLSMQAVLLFYIPKGRYSYLAWLLVFLIAVVTVRDDILPWIRRKHPRVLDAAAQLPGVRQIARLIGSPRWSLAYDLSRVSPRMGLLAGFRNELRPLVSPLNEVLDRVPRGCRLFDIGCGAGGLLHLALLRRQVVRAAGYDVSQRAVEAARRLSWRADVLDVRQCAPAEGVPDFTDADVVTMVDVLHHVAPAGQSEFVAQIADHMRPGARLVVADIDAARPIGRWLNQIHDLLVSGDWVHPRSCAEATHLISSAGLRVRETGVFRSLWYPHYLLVAEKPAD